MTADQSTVEQSLSRLPARWRSKIVVVESGCWLWTGATSSKGYGAISLHGKMRGAHRVIYEVLVGPIPEGLTIDHVKDRGCTSRACVNAIDHMEPVSDRENGLRGTSPTAINARKTHCDHGHEFTAENTRNDKDGRRCRACRRRDEQARRARKSEALAQAPPGEASGATQGDARKTHCPRGHEYTPENTRTRSGGRKCSICRREADRARWPGRKSQRKEWPSYRAWERSGGAGAGQKDGP